MKHAIFYGFLLAAAFVAVFVLAWPADAQQNHDEMHYWYKDLRNQEGVSCCNGKDCGQTSYRVHEGKLQVIIHERWCDVNERKILRKVAPDKGTHVCAPESPLEWDPCLHWCVIIGMGT